MSIKIYNSLTRKKEEFIPREKGKVGIYVCGVTVYDECHLGHLRSALIFDVIRQFFKYRGYEVTFVKNITDIDDKIIEKAKHLVSRGEAENLQSAVKIVAQKYTQLYHQDIAAMEIDPPDIEPLATEHILQIQEIIKKLIDKGYAYESEGSVYFQVDKFKGYGKLSGQSLGQMQAGARVEPNEHKKNLLDFALWKSSAPEEPFWESPWGKGRPGWHIECSAMSMKYLGCNFDIHAGGLDLIFPHHENEIAQSEAYSDQAFANYWLHNGLLTVNGEKMSKSLNNFITIKDLLKEYYPEEIKLFMLSVHYQSPLDFTYAKLEEARKARLNFYTLFDKIESLAGDDSRETATPPANNIRVREFGPKANKFYKQIEKCRADFEKAMDDNFNTAQALASLFELVSETNKFIQEEAVPLKAKIPILKCAQFTLMELGQILGLFKQSPVQTQTNEDRRLLNNLINLVIKIRSRLRQEKQFELADWIREELKHLGIVLEDGRGQTTWHREKVDRN